MASLYLGLNRGQTQKDVVTGAASPGKDIEVKIDDTKFKTKQEIVDKLDEMKNVLLQKSVQFQIFFAALLFGAALSHPVKASVLETKTINTATNNMPTAYDVTDVGSNMTFTASKVVNVKKLCCANGTTSALIAYIDNGTSTVSPTSGSKDWYFFASGGRCVAFNSRRTNLSVQWASDTGLAIASGKVRCEIHDAI
jgi:hypothetical protein